jgi:DNA-directed RNA polymerase I, II, and III subunit RPABC2|tara:strand:- start:1758 stop:2207 length:450 start_codon:yes stop_codon:yes gene_type:complete
MSNKETEIEINDNIESDSDDDQSSNENSDDESIEEISEIDNTEIENDEENIIFNQIDPEKELSLNKRIPDDERISLPYLTKYEKVNLIGTRAKQISDGSDIYVISKNVKTAVDISKLELEYKRQPFKIKRTMPDGRYEIWSLNELEILE